MPRISLLPPIPKEGKGKIESVRKLLRDKRLHRVLLKVIT